MNTSAVLELMRLFYTMSLEKKVVLKAFTLAKGGTGKGEAETILG